MRRRLLFSTLVVAVTAVMLFGIPLAFVMSRGQATDVRRQVHDQALQVGLKLQDLLNVGMPAASPDDQEAVTQYAPDRYVVIALDRGKPEAFNLPRPVGSGVIKSHVVTKDFSVTVEAAPSVASGDVVKSIALIAGLALSAITVAVGLAVLQARRLTQPLADLARAADRLGAADTGPLDRRYGIPELDRVAEGLDGSARRISELLAAERQFASDASHQLRTPLTALSMRLEEILAAADQPEVVKEEGVAALQQAERLAEVVGTLLSRTRRSAGATPEHIDVDDMVSQQVIEWEPAFRRRNRKLEVSGKKGLTAYATPGTLAQVVATLLDNALAHGDGTVTLRTSQTPKSVVVEVRDEGKGVDAELAPRIFERHFSGKAGGTGLGLALARSMAAADGGSVVLVRPRPAVFAVFVPREVPADGGLSPVRGPA